ncbi:hypothetical protein DFP72DRAFT_856783 [Ephemerocybe angulata]|uniref:Uncharacterized protein n=1 Tax=Ephemerocybe angulata TaxID=980116 RepID=A0A8H6HF01_9AGAR|nr:hypothetical protein DFP72DRAFT_856783 [Tulosesus angulatus]
MPLLESEFVPQPDGRTIQRDRSTTSIDIPAHPIYSECVKNVAAACSSMDLYRDWQASVPQLWPTLDPSGRGGGYRLGAGEIGAFEDEIGVEHGFISTYHLPHRGLILLSEATISPLHNILPVLKPSAQPLSPLLLITEDVDSSDSKRGEQALTDGLEVEVEKVVIDLLSSTGSISDDHEGRHHRPKRRVQEGADTIQACWCHDYEEHHAQRSPAPSTPMHLGERRYQCREPHAQATEKVGKKGVTTLMEWRTIEDDVEIIEGVHLDLSRFTLPALYSSSLFVSSFLAWSSLLSERHRRTSPKRVAGGRHGWVVVRVCMMIIDPFYRCCDLIAPQFSIGRADDNESLRYLPYTIAYRWLEVSIRAAPYRRDYYERLAQGASTEKLDKGLEKWLAGLDVIVRRITEFVEKGGLRT